MSTKKLFDQTGFTIIELVMVIVIIGILAAVAVPKFVDLKASSHTSVLKGVQGSLNGSIVMLHSRYLIDVASTYDATSVTGQVQQQGFTLAAAAGEITASVDASCKGTWTYTANGGVSSMASISAVTTTGC